MICDSSLYYNCPILFSAIFIISCKGKRVGHLLYCGTITANLVILILYTIHLFILCCFVLQEDWWASTIVQMNHSLRIISAFYLRSRISLCVANCFFYDIDGVTMLQANRSLQPSQHVFKVTDPSTTNADWSCFVSHRLSVVNHRGEDKSVPKSLRIDIPSKPRTGGWREFVTLTSLFDLDAGFLVNDCVMFAAEVLVLRETSELKVRF